VWYTGPDASESSAVEAERGERRVFRRAALWGALAGLALPVVWLFASAGAPWTVFPVGRALILLMAACGSYGALGAALAAGTVWAARQAPTELPPRPPVEEGSRLGPPTEHSP
jgi:hypothetical protein